MDRLADRILTLHPNAIPDVDFLLYQPEDGDVVIYNWNEDKLGPKPADAALQAVEIVLSQGDLLAYAADCRWRREVGGIIVSGVPISTDDRSKLMIAGARLSAMADPDWITPWHGADGGVYPLDATAIVAISDAVSAHVQASFTTFAAVKASIAGGTITTMAEIEAAFGMAG